MPVISDIDEILSISNNSSSSRKTAILEKKSHVPLAWIYINMIQIDEYIKKNLTDKNGVINRAEYEDEYLPFYVEVIKPDHPHLKINTESEEHFMEKYFFRGEDEYVFRFEHNRTDLYSLECLRRFYFTDSITLNLSGRLKNENPEKTSSSDIKSFLMSNEYKILQNKKLLLSKNLYVDCIFKIHWAGEGKPPEWYYPYPEKSTDLLAAQDYALRLLRERTTIKAKERKTSGKEIKISAKFRNTL